MKENLVIVDGMHIETGKLCFAVIDDDGWKYPQLGLFLTKENAKRFIEERKGA